MYNYPEEKEENVLEKYGRNITEYAKTGKIDPAVTAMKKGISVTEDYELRDFIAPTRLVFMALTPDALQHLHYDASQLSATVEDISDKLDPLLQHMWGPKMYRVILTVKSTKTTNKIKYTIR